MAASQEQELGFCGENRASLLCPGHLYEIAAHGSLRCQQPGRALEVWGGRAKQSRSRALALQLIVYQGLAQTSWCH